MFETRGKDIETLSDERQVLILERISLVKKPFSGIRSKVLARIGVIDFRLAQIQIEINRLIQLDFLNVATELTAIRRDISPQVVELRQKVEENRDKLEDDHDDLLLRIEAVASRFDKISARDEEFEELSSQVKAIASSVLEHQANGDLLITRDQLDEALKGYLSHGDVCVDDGEAEAILVSKEELDEKLKGYAKLTDLTPPEVKTPKPTRKKAASTKGA